MMRRIVAWSLSLLIHGIAVAAALVWTASPRWGAGPGSLRLRIVGAGDLPPSPAAGDVAAAGDGIAGRIEALRGLPPAEQLGLLEESAARARRTVRGESIAEIAAFLGLPAAADLETEPSSLHELDFASLTIVDIERDGGAGYRVRAADARGRWTWIEIEDPEDPHLWAAAEQAIRLVRSHPVLDAIYARCVLPLLPGIERDLAHADNGEVDTLPAAESP